MLDGVISDAGGEILFGEGEHRARIRVKAENALWSEEIVFRTPIDLAAPSSLSLAGGVLSFVGRDHATGYILTVNGEEVATVFPTDDKITLGQYIRDDGEYVLQLTATAGEGSLFAPSAPSRQILYVKDDAAYGTSTKHYQPALATELWSDLRKYPSANFRLTAGGVYDFSGYDFSSSVPFTFKGVLMGNGAILKNISISSPLFAALEGATIRDLTIEIEGVRFDFTQSGLLAKKISSSTLTGCAFLLKGGNAFTFGALCYEATDLTMRDSSVACDLTYESSTNENFGVIANDLKGTLSGVTLSGRVALSGRDVQCGAFSAKGEANFSDLASTLALTVNATGTATIAGISPNGTVTGSKLNVETTVTANAAYVFCYGVSADGATVSGTRLGGVLSAQGAVVSIYGVGGAKSLTDVTVATQLKGKATDEARIAGVTGLLSEETVTTGLSFAGEIDVNAPSVSAAGIATESAGKHVLRSAGTIKATGRVATVSSGVITADELDLTCAGSIALNKITEATVGGAAITASGKVTLSGSWLFLGSNAAMSGRAALSRTGIKGWKSARLRLRELFLRIRCVSAA